MIKRGNKRAQYFLISAIIIVLILSGFASIKTYAIIHSEPKQIKELNSELNEEGIRIIDYGIYEKKNLSSLLTNFTGNEFAPYFLQKTSATNILFIYGDSAQVELLQYNPEDTGTVSATIGSGTINWKTASIYANITSIDVSSLIDNKVKVNIFNKSYEFNVGQGQVFYFLIEEEKSGEVYIMKND
jgi:hypothetical protein